MKIGVATSVTQKQRMEAEIYPRVENSLLAVGPEQEALLRLFAPASHH